MIKGGIICICIYYIFVVYITMQKVCLYMLL